MSDPATSTAVDASLLEKFLDPEQLKKDLSINVANISESLANQTQLFVHYASQAVRARRQHERWKTALEILEARLDSAARRAASEAFGDDAADGKKKKPITEAQVRSAVVSDATWKATSSRVIDAQEIHRLCDVAERAFEHRREMVKQIASDQAREWDGQLRVMANQDGLSARDRLLHTMGQRAAGGPNSGG